MTNIRRKSERRICNIKFYVATRNGKLDSILRLAIRAIRKSGGKLQNVSQLNSHQIRRNLDGIGMFRERIDSGFRNDLCLCADVPYSYAVNGNGGKNKQRLMLCFHSSPASGNDPRFDI